MGFRLPWFGEGGDWKEKVRVEELNLYSRGEAGDASGFFGGFVVNVPSSCNDSLA